MKFRVVKTSETYKVDIRDRQEVEINSLEELIDFIEKSDASRYAVILKMPLSRCDYDYQTNTIMHETKDYWDWFPSDPMPIDSRTLDMWELEIYDDYRE